MNQTNLFANALRPRPDELFKPGSQNWRLYQRLLEGPVTNGEIIYQMRIANSTGRASDVRKALRPYLMDVESKRIEGSIWQYRLRG